ncbi:MAG: hypothetical protein RR290_00725 [Clostridia bacterium]
MSAPAIFNLENKVENLMEEISIQNNLTVVKKNNGIVEMYGYRNANFVNGELIIELPVSINSSKISQSVFLATSTYSLSRSLVLNASCIDTTHIAIYAWDSANHIMYNGLNTINFFIKSYWK